MTGNIYAVFTRRGIDRWLKNEPEAVAAGEFLVRVVVDLPDSVFAKRPVPVVRVSVPHADVAAADVTINGVRLAPSADVVAAKTQAVIGQFTSLFEIARRSPDPAMRQVADDALAALLAAGLEVRVTSEEAEPEVEL